MHFDQKYIIPILSYPNLRKGTFEEGVAAYEEKGVGGGQVGEGVTSISYHRLMEINT